MFVVSRRGECFAFSEDHPLGLSLDIFPGGCLLLCALQNLRPCRSLAWPVGMNEAFSDGLINLPQAIYQVHKRRGKMSITWSLPIGQRAYKTASYSDTDRGFLPTTHFDDEVNGHSPFPTHALYHLDRCRKSKPATCTRSSINPR